ncbi:MAG: LysM domain-containing protein [Solirubrobacterales bacterium]|nr:LysM domain-containing protein [Solirubrobacterales bacterium]
MPDRSSNYLGRFIAVLALLAAFVLVAVVVTGTGGSGSGEGSGETRTSPDARRSLNKGVYVVKPGDTLSGISAKLGIEPDDLLKINPDVDPQILSAGQRIRLP